MSYFVSYKYVLFCVLQICPILCPTNTSYFVSYKYVLFSFLQICPIFFPTNMSYYVSYKYVLFSKDLSFSLFLGKKLRKRDNRKCPILCPTNMSYLVSNKYVQNQSVHLCPKLNCLRGAILMVSF